MNIFVCCQARGLNEGILQAVSVKFCRWYITHLDKALNIVFEILLICQQLQT